MIVVKNINNNVALCLDSKGQEVVVFGKGVGFLKPPSEVPLSKIQRTFYDLNRKFLPLLDDIPLDVIDFTAQQVAQIRGQLPYETNANLIMTLADHLAFAMTRAKKGIYTPMPSIYEMEQNYPVEVGIGRQIIKAMEETFHVKLPKSEVQGVAMHFINASLGSPSSGQLTAEEEYETILERMTQIVELCTAGHHPPRYLQLRPLCDPCAVPAQTGAGGVLHRQRQPAGLRIHPG